MGSQVRRGRIKWVFTAAAALCFVGSAGCRSADAQPKEEIKRGPHGDAEPAAQKSALSSLGVWSGDGVPAGVDPVMWAALVPKDNEPTAQRILLGQMLYFDQRLSRDGTVSCATCHDVTRGFTDQRPVSEGVDGKLGRRNAPTTVNAALLTSQFWDGRAATLEEQAVLPITNPIEMAQPSPKAAVDAIKGDAEYQRLFNAAYGRPPNFEDIGRAIASFERTLVFLDAPFDRYVGGDAEAMTATQIAGFRLFSGKARCVTCHPLSVANPLGTDGRFHNIGVSARAQDFHALSKKALDVLAKDGSSKAVDALALETDMSQLGRFLVTKRPHDMGAFRTPGVRNLGVTAPYMHDGSMATLFDVVDHYNKGGEAHGFLDGGIEPLALSEDEITQLVDFMFALTDSRFESQLAKEKTSQTEAALTRRPFRDDELAHRKKIMFSPKKSAK